MTPPDNDWSQFIPPERSTELTNRDDANAVELAGHWKHGYIPLDEAAWHDKTKGVRGGTKWWDGPDRPKSGSKPAKKMLTSKEVPSAKAGKRPYNEKMDRVARATNGPSVRDRARLQELEQKKKNRGLTPQEKKEHAGLARSVSSGQRGSIKPYHIGKISSMETPKQQLMNGAERSKLPSLDAKKKYDYARHNGASHPEAMSIARGGPDLNKRLQGKDPINHKRTAAVRKAAADDAKRAQGKA